MSTENKEAMPLPVHIRHWSEQHGLISTYPMLHDALQTEEVQLTDREIERIGHYLTELMENLVKGRGRLPQDVIPTPAKGDMTHVLDGRLLRRQGIWIGLHFAKESGIEPLSIVSINRGCDESNLHSILGGTRVKSVNRRVHHPKRSGSHK